MLRFLVLLLIQRIKYATVCYGSGFRRNNSNHGYHTDYDMVEDKRTYYMFRRSDRCYARNMPYVATPACYTYYHIIFYRCMALLVKNIPKGAYT